MRGAGSWRTVPGSLPGLAPGDLPPLRLLRHPLRVKASIVRETSSSRAGWPGDLILLLPGKQNCHRGHASSRRRWSAPVPSVQEPGFARPAGCSRAGPDPLESERAAPGPSCSLGTAGHFANCSSGGTVSVHPAPSVPPSHRTPPPAEVEAGGLRAAPAPAARGSPRPAELSAGPLRSAQLAFGRVPSRSPSGRCPAPAPGYKSLPETETLSGK